MPKFVVKILSLNLSLIILLAPNLVFARIEAKSPQAENKEWEFILPQNSEFKPKNEAPLSLTPLNCQKFMALSLIYLPPEMKKKENSLCKKASKKGKIKYSQKKSQAGEVFKTDILAKTSIVSDFIYQTPYDPIYRAAEEKFGIPWQILSVIHEVESGRSGDTYMASYMGATGPMQFLPSTFAYYGRDGDGDGRALISDVDDAIFSAAHYLAANGGASGNLSGALYHYNHDFWYVNLVLYKAKSLGYLA